MNAVVEGLLGILLVQFVGWVMMTVDLWGVESERLRWYAWAALWIPVFGLVVSMWYFTHREQMRSATVQNRSE